MPTETIEIKIDKKLARKVLGIVDAGLVKGLGEPRLGAMCVEAAVNYALGAPHGDSPACVGLAVREFKIKLNDCDWSSDAARTTGMRKLAIAQLGSNEINQVEFAKLLALRTTTIFLADFLESRGNKDLASACRKAKTLEEAYATARAAADAAFAAADAAYAAAYAAADAAAYAADAADAAADFVAYAAARAAYAATGAAGTAAGAAAGAARAAARDKWLTKMADIGLGVLIELKSPGCKFLDLCD